VEFVNIYQFSVCILYDLCVCLLFRFVLIKFTALFGYLAPFVSGSSARAINLANYNSVVFGLCANTGYLCCIIERSAVLLSASCPS